MSYPTKELSWQFAVNLTVGGGESVRPRNLNWMLKDTLCSFAVNPWVVISSSNGTDFGTSDYWQTQADLANTNGVWVVLENSAGAQLMIHGSGYYFYEGSGYKFSPSGGFVYIDANTAPTAADSISMSAGIYGPWICNPGTQHTEYQNLHILHDATGKHTRAVVCGSNVCHWIAMFSTIEPSPGVVITNPQVGVMLSNNGNVSLYPATWGYLNTVQNVAARVNSTTVKLSCAAETFSTLAPTSLTTVMATTGNWAVCPITGLWSTTVGYVGKYAIPSSAAGSALPDVLWGSASIGTGAGYLNPAGNSRDWVQFGDLVLPWNNTAVNVV